VTVFILPRAFTAGEARRSRRVGGLTLAEVHYDASRRPTAESHTHDRFVLVLKGLCAIRETGETHRASTLLFVPAGTRHTVESSHGATCLVVDMDQAWLGRARQQAAVLTEPAVLRGGLALHLAHRLYGEFRLRDEVSPLAIESLALGVLAEASRRVAARATRPEAPDWLLQARAVADQHFAERLLLVTVAAMVGVHPVHLSRTFRRVYNTTFADYVRDVRLEFARSQLVLTTVPLGDIAAAAGFYDQSHFCRLFKQATGLSPAEYRVRS